MRKNHDHEQTRIESWEDGDAPWFPLDSLNDCRDFSLLLCKFLGIKKFSRHIFRWNLAKSKINKLHDRIFFFLLSFTLFCKWRFCFARNINISTDQNCPLTSYFTLVLYDVYAKITGRLHLPNVQFAPDLIMNVIRVLIFMRKIFGESIVFVHEFVILHSNKGIVQIEFTIPTYDLCQLWKFNTGNCSENLLVSTLESVKDEIGKHGEHEKAQAINKILSRWTVTDFRNRTIFSFTYNNAIRKKKKYTASSWWSLE